MKLTRAQLEKALQLAAKCTAGPYYKDTPNDSGKFEVFSKSHLCFVAWTGKSEKDAANIAHNADPEFVKSVVTALIECRRTLEDIAYFNTHLAVDSARDILDKHFSEPEGEQ